MPTVESLPPLSLDAPLWICLRQQEELRKVMLERRFDEVERLLAELEEAWWQADAVPDDRYTFLATSSALFDNAGVDAALRLELLNEWVRSHPASYHAHMISGEYYFRRACDIRTASWASEVGEDQWIAAHMACIDAAECLLKAMALSQRPAVACETMMQICQYLGQPDFIDALFDGGPVQNTMQRDEFEPDIYEAACAQLARYGLKPPGIATATLPVSAPPVEEGDLQNPGYYWLRYCLSFKPGWGMCLRSMRNI